MNPVAIVVNNNQPDNNVIVQVPPNVTLPIGAELYLNPSVEAIQVLADGTAVEKPGPYADNSEEATRLRAIAERYRKVNAIKKDDFLFMLGLANKGL